MKERRRPDDDRFEGFMGIFSKEDSPSAKSSRENKGDATRRRKWNQGRERMRWRPKREESGRRAKRRHARRVYRLPTRCLGPQTESEGENVTKSTVDRISFLSGCEQIRLLSNRAFPSLRGVAESLIFRPFPKKGDDASRQ